MKKKLVIIFFAVLLVIGIAGTFWGPSIALAARSIWDSCPRGEVNDPYPGDCRDYIDTNKDGICDRSQPAPISTITTAKPSGVPATTTTPVSPALANLPVTGAGDSGSGNEASSISSDASSSAEEQDAVQIRGRSYYFIPVLISLIVLYALTWILSAKKAFKTLTHRKIWNVVLLVSSLVSALLGIVLVLNLDLDTNISLPFNMLFWHVEAGLAMAVVAVFHIAWHWRYFIRMVKPKE